MNRACNELSNDGEESFAELDWGGIGRFSGLMAGSDRPCHC
jgi:hypothetical protein